MRRGAKKCGLRRVFLWFFRKNNDAAAARYNKCTVRKKFFLQKNLSKKMHGKKLIKKSMCAKNMIFYKDTRILWAFLPITIRKIGLLRIV